MGMGRLLGAKCCWACHCMPDEGYCILNWQYYAAHAVCDCGSDVRWYLWCVGEGREGAGGLLRSAAVLLRHVT